MTGLMEKLKNLFGGNSKDKYEHEVPRRLEVKKEEVATEEFTPRYKLARQQREDREIDTPIVKRKRF
ncbi:MAG: hypothetical protein WCW44_01010 [archaeon]|jgi:hypothetical protein